MLYPLSYGRSANVNFGVSDRARTGDLQGHNLAL